MTQIQQYSPYVVPNGVQMQTQTPYTSVPSTQQGTVSVTAPNSAPVVYSYPTTSLYSSNTMQQTPNGVKPQPTSGVNIIINNPSAIGGASANSYSCPSSPQEMVASQPISNTSIADKEGSKTDKKKQIVQLTNDYIRTLESYLRSNDSHVRKSAIVDLIKRFEEDPSRYDNPQLTALLNIALQDPEAENRMLAMGPIAGEKAHGDANTIKILQILQGSDKIFGQEAKMATDSLLKAAQQKQEVPQ